MASRPSRKSQVTARSESDEDDALQSSYDRNEDDMLKTAQDMLSSVWILLYTFIKASLLI
jgi:hypothetical protein